MLDELAQLIPRLRSIGDTKPVGGGCISSAFRVTGKLDDAPNDWQDWFVKSNDESFLDNFQCEWKGLHRLHDAGGIAVPQPIAVGVAGGKAWLVLPWVEQVRTDPNFFLQFGQGLARLHQATLGTQIGLDHDNFLGSARQINSSAPSWPEFVADHRIKYQLRWTVDQGLASLRLKKDVETIVRDIDQVLIGREDSTSLLHGDLWSGNYLCRSDGAAVVIDPAVYHGCREAEFGMLQLFGSCPAEFYQAYQDAFPMPDGWQRRTRVYVLYHLLNHLNLFGSGYRSQCESVAAEILA